MNPGPGRVLGWVVGENWVATVDGDRSPFDGKANPAPFAGTYTMTIPPPSGVPTGPQGHGFGTIRIDAKGVATYQGTMADGTKAVQKVSLSGDGHWPFHLNLYKGGGTAMGWLVVSRGDIGGVVQWIKPSSQSIGGEYVPALALQSSVIGSRYVPPAGGNAPEQTRWILINCRGGGLLEPLHGSVVIFANGSVVVQTGYGIKFSLAPQTGLFKGTIRDHVSKQLLEFSGVLLQKWGVGAGIVMAPTDVGYVGIAVD